MKNTGQLETFDFSKLYRYSVGIVVEDNINNESVIKVYPIEKLYTEKDDLNKKIKVETTLNVKSMKNDIDKTDDIEYIIYKAGKEKISIDKTKYLYCTFLNKSNNSLLPVNVCKGERVVIYRFSNRDEFYWTVENSDLKYRKEEHVVYSYSDKDNLDDTEDEIEDRYTFTISTKDKYISLHTTDKYGEYTTYDLKIDTKNGIVNLIDGKSNELVWDSTKDKVGLHIEGSGAKYDLELSGDEGYVSLIDNKNNSFKLDSNEDSLTAITNNSINAKTVDYNIECTNYNVKANNFNIETKSYDLKSTSNKITSDKTEYSPGKLTMAGIDLSMTHYHVGNLGLPTSVPNDA